METIDIHLVEMAGWRALLTKAQFVAQIEIHPMLEEYLLRLLFRVTRTPRLTGLSRSRSGVDGDGNSVLTEDGHLAVIADTIGRHAANDQAGLATVGDHCLLSAGLFPEQAILSNFPLTNFVKVGQAAYREFGEAFDEPIFEMLSDHFVDAMDVLQTLRELEQNNICIDPLNAYQLWRDTGSTYAWQILRRITPSLPGNDQSAVLH